MNYIKLYERESEPDAAYLIGSGQVVAFINNHDKYVLSGNNYIAGATELMLTHVYSIPVKRLETLVVPEGTAVKKIPIDSFLASRSSFQFLMNIALVICRQLLLTNGIAAKNQLLLNENTDSMRDTAMNFYYILQILFDEYNKRKLPWLKTFLKPYETSLLFKRGEIFAKAVDPVRIVPSDAFVEQLTSIPRGSFLCKQGDNGRDMFILESGTIDVIVNDKRVASFGDKGTVIGEIALFLGEKRSASLKTAAPSVVYKINKDQLKASSQKDTSLLQTILFSLAKKHLANIGRIIDTNERILFHELDTEDKGAVAEAQQLQSSISELKKLKHEVSELIYKNKADFIREAVNSYLN